MVTSERKNVETFPFYSLYILLKYQAFLHRMS